MNRSAHRSFDGSAARHVFDADLAEVTCEVPDRADRENEHGSDKPTQNDSLGHDESSKKLWRKPMRVPRKPLQEAQRGATKSLLSAGCQVNEKGSILKKSECNADGFARRRVT
jgi:hypothetical protein